ncbi:MAG TPA: Fic family protein [Candidatus Dormibacteraeota bacterium]|nr:Fic family protein [Candidatus Dormibacteraeota bacterium]
MVSNASCLNPPRWRGFSSEKKFYLCRNHPFVDDNKRTALATCLVFLSENDLLPREKLDVERWEALTLDVAASRIDREQTTERLTKLLCAAH